MAAVADVCWEHGGAGGAIGAAPHHITLRPPTWLYSSLAMSSMWQGLLVAGLSSMLWQWGQPGQVFASKAVPRSTLLHTMVGFLQTAGAQQTRDTAPVASVAHNR